MKEDPETIGQANVEFALARLARSLRTTVVEEAVAAAVGAAAAASSSDETGDLLALHAAARQFVHGVGAFFVAKTRNGNQLPDWTEIQNKPEFATGGDIDMDSIRIDASQVISGIFSLLRLPVAEPGAATPNTLVRANDPRLSTPTIVLSAGEAVGQGDWLRVEYDGGESKVFRADATTPAGKAIGFSVESRGIDDPVQVFTYGENPYCTFPLLTSDDVGATIFLSTTPGRGTLTPPSGDDMLIQPLGTLTRMTSSTFGVVLVRYEYRITVEPS
jgi:hypothetical protein